jgi:hypothetical protein
MRRMGKRTKERERERDRGEDKEPVIGGERARENKCERKRERVTKQ